MVCGADAIGPSSSNRSNSDLEIGCLIDLATGLVSFTANGKELPTSYQVKKNNRAQLWGSLTHRLIDVQVINVCYFVYLLSNGAHI